MRKTHLLLVCVTMLLCRAYAQSTPPMPEMAHHHHPDAPDASEKLGEVSFPTSCAARSQGAMERGIALLHSFGYTEAQMQFSAIAKDDPACAMAHWGIAMTQFEELWSPPDAAGLKLGAAEMAKARALAAPPAATTPREQAYIAALSAFFDPKDAKFQQRADAYEAKMNALHRDFPDDVEGAAFDALSILASVAPDDTSLTHQHEALAILVPLYASHPDHPGLAHYIIHTCDTPALAAEGLGAAREYARIAPSSPHALHMPGHIFARLGMWPEDIDSNLASVAASEKAEAAGLPGSAHQMHADEFLIYAYLQVGEDEKARVLTYKMRSISEHMSAMPGMDDMKDDGRLFDNELRTIYAAEMHDWKTLSTQEPAPGSKAYEAALTYWGQGIAAGHLHDAKLAAAATANFDKDFEALKKSPYADFVAAMEIKGDEIGAWKAYADDRPEAAVAAMRKAADQQDKLGQMEVDIPAREMLGDLLLLQHKPEEALTEYRVALTLSPNRLNGLLSAGAAATQANKPDEARSFYKAASQQTDSGAHSLRPDLTHAVQIVGDGWGPWRYTWHDQNLWSGIRFRSKCTSSSGGDSKWAYQFRSRYDNVMDFSEWVEHSVDGATTNELRPEAVALEGGALSPVFETVLHGTCEKFRELKTELKIEVMCVEEHDRLGEGNDLCFQDENGSPLEFKRIPDNPRYQ